MTDLVAELEAAAGALEARGVEFAVCGGLAVAMHGHVRATRDIDLLVPAASADAAALECARAAIGELHVEPSTTDGRLIHARAQ